MKTELDLDDNEKKGGDILSDAPIVDVKNEETVLSSYSEIGAEILDRMPDVSEHVTSERENVTNPGTVQPDDFKHVFNPEIHVEKDGKPVLNKDGSFKKKPGKKKGVDYSQPRNHSTIGGGAQGESVKPPEINQDAIMISKLGTVCAIRTRLMMGGPDADAGEQAYLEDALLTWAEASEVAMSPTAGLIGALAIFYMPVVTAPKEQNFFVKTARTIKGFFTRSPLPEAKKSSEAKQ